MNALLITNGSKKIYDDENGLPEKIFLGTFNQIKSFEEKFNDYITINTKIISKNYGLLDSKSIIDTKGEYNPEKIRNKLKDMISNYEIIFVLLKGDIFKDVFSPSENDDLIKYAKEGALWGFFIPKSAYDLIDEKLIKERDYKIVVGYRVGVSRYTNKFVNKLLKEVKEYVL